MESVLHPQPRALEPRKPVTIGEASLRFAKNMVVQKLVVLLKTVGHRHCLSPIED
jgi:hypothetical protein